MTLPAAGPGPQVLIRRALAERRVLRHEEIAHLPATAREALPPALTQGDPGGAPDDTSLLGRAAGGAVLASLASGAGMIWVGVGDFAARSGLQDPFLAVLVLCAVLGVLALVAGAFLAAGIEAGLARAGLLPLPVNPKDRFALPVREEDLREGEDPPQRGFPHRLRRYEPGAGDPRGKNGVLVACMGMAGAALFAAGGWVPGGLASKFAAAHLPLVLASCLMWTGNSGIADADLLVPELEVGCGETLPLQLRVVAGRDLGVRGVTLRFLTRDARWRRHEPEDGRPYWAAENYWREEARLARRVDSALLRGQELRMLLAFRVPDAATLTVLEEARSVDWFVQVHLDLVRYPDACLEYRFPVVLEAREEGTVATAPVELGADFLAAEVTCPFCGAPIVGADAVACAACETLHHGDCWSSHGSCTTYACGSTASREVLLDPGP